MTDVYTIAFDSTTLRALKYLKPTDVISGTVKLSSLSYSPAFDTDITVGYSIVLKGIRIFPYRSALTRDFTSLSFGEGNSDTGVGFTVSTVNAADPLASSGILYLTSGGSTEKMGTAKKAVIAAIIGTLVIVLAPAAFDIIFQLFG